MNQKSNHVYSRNFGEIISIKPSRQLHVQS